MDDMEMMVFFSDLTETLWGNYGFQALFYFSLVLIAILERERLRKVRMLWYPACILLVIYNPVMYFACRDVFFPSGTLLYYFRMFCLLPIVFVIAHAAVLVLKRVSGRKKLCCTVAILLAIALSGHSQYGEAWFVKARNFNKVPEDVRQICAMFEGTEGKISIMVPTDLTVYMRQTDSDFSMPYGRDGDALSNRMQSGTANVVKVMGYAAATGTEYIVTAYSVEMLAEYISRGCEIMGYTERYVVIRVVASEKQ